MFKFTYTNIVFFLKVLLFILVILILICVWYVRKLQSYDSQYLSYSSELRVLTQKIGKSVGEISAFGFESSFTELQTRQAEFDKIIKLLIQGEYNKIGTRILPPSPLYIQQGSLAKLDSYWQEKGRQIDMILSNKDLIMTSQKTNEIMQAKLAKISSLYWDVLKKTPKSELTIKVLLDISSQVETIRQLKSEFQKLLTITISGIETEKRLPTEIDAFAKRARKIRDDNKNINITPLLDNITLEIQSIEQSYENMIKTGFILDTVFYATESLMNDNLMFLGYTTNLYDDYANDPHHRKITHATIYILCISGLLVLILIGYLLNRQSKVGQSLTERKNRKINQDIDTLLQELSNLAGGNLAIKATENKGITLEIAKSINYAIQALRKLVQHINFSSQQASNLSLETQKITTDLALSSDKQLKEIIKSVYSIQSLEKLAEKVSLHANESAAVARQSVDLAKKGSLEVRNTINGMLRIQEQIRTTSNKMLRLNESSNEIGQIITMIDGIADQTNILSLNAAIQAAMAGEAGQGFDIIADEVQSLAEKVRRATQEIETLVRSIQLETREVIDSMEETRIEMKHGSELARNAGKSLEKIESVSQHLAKHIQSITQTSEKQRKMTTTMARMITIVEEISKNFANGSTNTAEFTRKLTELVIDLRSTVSGFKLSSNTIQSKD